ncbi:methyltransferase domain-containing protein [Candidatus Saccharibacteria bacterium]|nr:methyltransferase domain-containing protein [Candidatus Saccharibacteria bacterium]
MRYLAVLGRQPEISIAELEAQGFSIVENGSCPNSFFSGAAPKALAQVLGPSKKEFRPPVSKSIAPPVDIKRFGGVLKLAIELEQKPLEYLQSLSEGKITIGVSDYSKNASRRTASSEALKLKKILVRHGRSVRVVENKEATLSTATSLHNGLGGKNERKVEFIKVNDEWFRVIGVQDIEAYAKRDQARPARDAKVGMLPPKLAQVLINLCGPLVPGSVVLDPFCGTGVVLQESLLMGYRAYGTDINERMVSYSKKNLDYFKFKNYEVEVGDATSFEWKKPINAVACEGYLGRPFSKVPSEMSLKKEKQECATIILGFLKNLSGQISKGTPVTLAAPAWLRENGSYERLDIIDEIIKLGYNVSNKTQEGLFYHREGQVVARDIIILRKN